jgi:hypothetical protein
MYGVVEIEHEYIRLNSLVYFIHSSTKYRLEIAKTGVSHFPFVGRDSTTEKGSFMNLDDIDSKDEPQVMLPEEYFSSVTSPTRVRSLGNFGHDWWEYTFDTSIRPTEGRPDGEVRNRVRPATVL